MESPWSGKAVLAYQARQCQLVRPRALRPVFSIYILPLDSCGGLLARVQADIASSLHPKARAGSSVLLTAKARLFVCPT